MNRSMHSSVCGLDSHSGKGLAKAPIALTRHDLRCLERLLESDRVKAIPGTAALRDELDRADEVAPEDIAADVVTMNSTVRFVDEEANVEHELTLVYPHEAGKAGTVSIFAPVGSALLGLSVGQSFEWQVPDGRNLVLRVVNISNQPEACLRQVAVAS